MTAHHLKVGDRYYYISVPCHCNWMETKVLSCTYKEEQDLSNYIYTTVPTAFDELLTALKEKIQEQFRQGNDGWEPDGLYYWVTLNYAPHLKTIHVKGEEAPGKYDCNYFKSEQEAQQMKETILKTFASFGIQL